MADYEYKDPRYDPRKIPGADHVQAFDDVSDWLRRYWAEISGPAAKGYEAGGIPGALGGTARGVGNALAFPAHELFGAGDITARMQSGFTGTPPVQFNPAAAPSLPAAPAPSPTAAAAPPAPPITSPYVNYSAPNVQIPGLPDTSAAQAAMQAAAPSPEQPPPELANYIMRGLLAGVGPATAPTGSRILGMALGALQGQGAHGDLLRQMEEKDETARREYQRWLATQQGQGSQQEFQNKLAQTETQTAMHEAAQMAQVRNAAQLTPTVSGKTVVTKEKKGDQIQYNINQLSDPAVQAKIQALQLGAANNPKLLFNTLMQSPGGAQLVQEAADAVGVNAQALRAVGVDEKGVSQAAMAQLMQYIAQTDPEIYAALLERAKQQAIVEALSK